MNSPQSVKHISRKAFFKHALELGKGFTFVGRQYKITVNNIHYHVDLVFYHRILKCFVLIDLKKNSVRHEDISDDGTRKKIFYNTLLPYEINQLLQNSKNNGKVSVTMHEFPIDKNEVTNVIFDFISDRQRQDLLKNGKNVSIDSIVQHIGLENLNFGFSCAGIGYDLNKPYEYLFNHDIYLYAENKDINYRVPICHMWRAESAQTKMEVSVCVNGKEYFKSCEILHTPDYDEIHFGKSIIVKEPHKGNPSLCFALKGNIDERISAIEFLLDMVDGKGITVDGINIKTEFYAQQIEEFGLKGLKVQLKYLKDVKDVLESVVVQILLECDNITDKDESYIKMLLLGIKYGEPINFNNEKVPPIGHIAIANLNIILHFIVVSVIVSEL